ncbi:MAG: hypothetical protein HOD11_04055 [Candidatus Marinimicrobia bacterium]|nr:hypothetical protein [Candidatus Neomarinimicrobiota bacterium]
MDIQKEALLHNFKTLKNHCSILDPTIIKEYFPDGDFETALNKFFDVEIRDVESFYALDYPFQGEIVFDENKFVDLVDVIPEFIVSLIKVGMPFIVSLHKYQRSRKSEPVLLSLPNLVESSKIVYHSWNLLGDLLQQGSKERQSSIAELESKLGQLVRTKPHYDLLGTLQNVYNSIVLMALSEDILEQGLLDLFIHPDKVKREALYSLAGRELSALRTLDCITNIDGIDEIIPRIRQDLLKNGYPKLSQQVKNVVHELEAEYLTTSIDNELEPCSFQNMGDFWKISYRGVSAHLRRLDGFHYLKHLLEHENESFRADILKNITGFANHAENLGAHGDVGEKSTSQDAVQLKEPLSPYKRGVIEEGLAEMKEGLNELHPNSDEYSDLEDRISQYEKIMSANYNHHNKERNEKDSGSNARTAVKKAINRAYKRIDAEIPDLVVFLRRNVDTGIKCQYTPPPDNPPDWRF